MSFRSSNFKTIARAGIVAVALGFTALAVAPAQAADNSVNFGFSIQTPDGLSFSFGNKSGFSARQFNSRPQQRACLSEQQIRVGLRRQGFSNAQMIGGGNRGWVKVHAERRGGGYTMDVNACTGDIANLQQDRRGGGRFGGNSGGHRGWGRH